MKIGKINSNKLRNSVLFQFHTEFRNTITKHYAETLNVKKQFDAYLLRYSNLFFYFAPNET